MAGFLFWAVFIYVIGVVCAFVLEFEKDADIDEKEFKLAFIWPYTVGKTVLAAVRELRK